MNNIQLTVHTIHAIVGPSFSWVEWALYALPQSILIAAGVTGAATLVRLAVRNS